MQRDTQSGRIDTSPNRAGTGLPLPGKDIRDGYEIHRAALEHGLNVRLLPRQVMEVALPEDMRNTSSFVHGMPQQTTLSGATYAQDLRVRRAMLVHAGFAVPRGATFSIGRSRALSRKFAERVGFPVVVKPAIGENTIEVQSDIRNSAQFTAAIDYLLTPPQSRQSFFRAAYALTELREPGQIDGKIVAPPGYRFLVEKQVQGQYVRFLILNGEVRNIIFCPDGPWNTAEQSMRNITDETHSTIIGIAQNVARAIPGLAVAAVDMVLQDYTAKTKTEDAQIVELSERPWLSVQAKVSPHLASKLGNEILLSALPQASGRPLRQRVDIEVLIGGAVDPLGLLEAIEERFDELEIRSTLHESDHTLGQIRGQVRGTPAQIARVFEQLLDQGINQQRAMLVEQKVL